MAQRPSEHDRSPEAIESAEQQAIDEITAAVALVARGGSAISRVSIVSCCWSWRVAAAVQHAARQHGVRITLEGGEEARPATILIQRAGRTAASRQRPDSVLSAELSLVPPGAGDQSHPRDSVGKDLAAG